MALILHWLNLSRVLTDLIKLFKFMFSKHAMSFKLLLTWPLKKVRGGFKELAEKIEGDLKNKFKDSYL